MICFGLTGYLMNAAFSRLERALMPWRQDDAGKLQ
jgi:ABC-type nitrate/sulfonate/bicarbonate transport system permease component